MENGAQTWAMGAGLLRVQAAPPSLYFFLFPLSTSSVCLFHPLMNSQTPTTWVTLRVCKRGGVMGLEPARWRAAGTCQATVRNVAHDYLGGLLIADSVLGIQGRARHGSGV